MKFKKTLLPNLAPMLFLMVAGCGINENKNHTGANPQLANKISYADVNAKVFQASCKGCHTNGGSRAGITLNSFAEVKANLDAIQDAVFNGVPSLMPKGGMPIDQQQLLQAWITQGAVENPDPTVPTLPPVATATPVPTAPPVLVPLLPNYQSILTDVFSAKCLQCHAAKGPAADAPLDTYASMIAAGNLVVPNDIASSGVVTKIIAGTMPPTRSHIPKVTPVELAVIQLWITSGAPEFPAADPAPSSSPAPSVSPLPPVNPLPSVSPPSPVIPMPSASPAPSVAPEPAPSPTASPIPSPLPAPTAPPANPPQLVATYQSIRDTVFASKCLICHAPGGHASFAPMDTYASLMNDDGMVNAGNPDTSKLVSEIESGDMPPKRANLPAVTADELAMIKLWITNGAKP